MTFFQNSFIIEKEEIIKKVGIALNILFFLTPKEDVAYIYDDSTLGQAMEVMQNRQYTAVPVISKKGAYIGTLTEGDILRNLREHFSLDLEVAQNVPVSQMAKQVENIPVSVNARIEDLIIQSMNQNFVPVIDDQNIFIGIVTRKEIIQYCYKKVFELKRRPGK